MDAWITPWSGFFTILCDSSATILPAQCLYCTPRRSKMWQRQCNLQHTINTVSFTLMWHRCCHTMMSLQNRHCWLTRFRHLPPGISSSINLSVPTFSLNAFKSSASLNWPLCLGVTKHCTSLQNRYTIWKKNVFVALLVTVPSVDSAYCTSESDRWLTGLPRLRSAIAMLLVLASQALTDCATKTVLFQYSKYIYLGGGAQTVRPVRYFVTPLVPISESYLVSELPPCYPVIRNGIQCSDTVHICVWPASLKTLTGNLLCLFSDSVWYSFWWPDTNPPYITP